MVSLELALKLRTAGLRWEPARGDRFILPHRGMDEDVFVLSDMTVDVHHFPTGRVIGFNGTTEWALDSVEASEAVWVPAEHQLRGMLGGLFRRLARKGEGYVVDVELPGGPASFGAPDADDAYAQALLAVLQDVHADTV